MNPLMNPAYSNAEGKLNCINAVVITYKKELKIQLFFYLFSLFLLVFIILIFLEFCDILSMLIIKKLANILF